LLQRRSLTDWVKGNLKDEDAQVLGYEAPKDIGNPLEREKYVIARIMARNLEME
jgi:hypothetical protein